MFQPGKMNIRVAGGKKESWFPPCASCLWEEALWAALVHSVLVSLLSPASCHQWHKRWEMLGCPRQQERGPVMEVLVQLGYKFVHAAGPVGMGGNCLSSEGSESCCCTEAHLGTFWG